MANHILLVFEGEKAEKLVFQSFKEHFLNESENTVIYGVYCSEIYSLYHRLHKDTYLYFFFFLKEKLQNADLLKDVKSSDVSEIYLFFDFDGQATAAEDKKLQAMLEHFDEETENGKLYISYPMVEAIKHLSTTVEFQNVVVNGRNNIKYKGLVHKEGDKLLRDLSALSFGQWQYIIDEHCKKLNHLVNDVFSLPTDYISQSSIFEKQKQKHLDNHSSVAVLSAFPIFIADYYGYKKINEILMK